MSHGAPRANEAYQQSIHTLNPSIVPDHENVYAPFISKMDWEIAQWAKLRGPGSTAFSELLAIDGVADALNLSFKNTPELNRIIDNKLPSNRPPFLRDQIEVAGQSYDVYYRDIIQCVRALFGDPNFDPNLILQPERHYTDSSKQKRVYHDMHTGMWWWDTQVDLEAAKPGATIVPLIISSDKTQLTLFRNKSAYPIYLTIGNIPKHIRSKPSKHAQILLGYLPTARLEHVRGDASRRRALGNLFHGAVARILEPIITYGETGIPMTRASGAIHRCHPIFAIFVGDYPEQCAATATKHGHCPKGTTPHDQLGEPPPHNPTGNPHTSSGCPKHDIEAILQALELYPRDPTGFVHACNHLGIKPVARPFWKDLPYHNIYVSITPDILHQLYQGLIKHLIAWLKEIFGAHEIDARCQRMPLNHCTRIFTNGITSLSRITGKEHRQICAILLGLIVDLPLPSGQSPTRLITATRAALDFLYIAQLPVQSADTLTVMQDSLKIFHSNKQIFVELGIRKNFNLPKLHSMSHYYEGIMNFGTTDNYNTEMSERLHIDLAKEAYRSTNHRDEYPQMTGWLERREKIQRHSTHISARLNPLDSSRDNQESCLHLHPTASKYPSVKAVSLDSLTDNYGTHDFGDALADFIIGYKNPSWSTSQIRHAAENLLIPFRRVPVFHHLKFRDNNGSIYDAIDAQPSRKNTRGQLIPGRFDTVLVKDESRAGRHIHPYRVAQVRAIFTLPQHAIERWFPSNTSHPGPPPPKHLAYVEWFTPFAARPHSSHGMYKIRRSYQNNRRLASVIDIQCIYRSVHLIPCFGPEVPLQWTSFNVLDECDNFYVNCFTDRHTYITLCCALASISFLFTTSLTII
ncbi:hypothetical protein PUNSTDRAFT_56509 [Punctularia strigosozonata HHB-11173 SS5]|uniref:uncharacterized protein n=1 Tax=Punctularia strigosozonata (strain HHB-11173) TaxID=741275 RepID=UPI0004417901|nr:uncharacterized protein PUNSTDRAFT_56509 [Punctularia strigosozonata HHB-11173 SS5]EIN13427.1 hypothetical protein PUNSTDRAFT_56509 [Punctularia strigosozonata HHB-11173 SS5]